MKRALVTGGSGGLGKAISLRLGAAGYHVIVHGNRNRDKAEEVARAIRDAQGSAEAVAFDVTDPVESEQVLAGLADAGPIQVLVSNAGTHRDGPLAGMSHEQWREVIDVSLNGFFNVTRPLVMPMIRTRWGRIIAISSVVGVTGNRGQANYAAAKAGLHGATKSLAVELASRGITVNAVAPGFIAAGMAETSVPRTVIEAVVPMKRAGTAEEVAGTIAFLTSADAAYITGQVIGINGGLA
jgi:3-oxoacyl-[acyl-carrier protein] reductase